MPFNNPVSEKLENIYYGPQIPTTNNLEAATKTINATAEATGLANKDYSAALTLPIPTDARLAIMRIAARLAVTVDSMTATHLYCKVYVDAQDAEHLLFSEDITATGAKLDAVDLYTANKATLFNLLKDGAAHTLYFYFWVNAGNAVLSVVQGWECVGTCATSEVEVLRLSFAGSISYSQYATKTGTGTPTMSVYGLTSGYPIQSPFTNYNTLNTYLTSGIKIFLYGTVGTDINSAYKANFELRRMG